MTRPVDIASAFRQRPAAPQASSTNIQRGLWLGGAVLIAAMVVFAAYDVTHRRDLVIGATQQEVAGLARTLAQQTAGVLRAVDTVLRDTAADALVGPSGDPHSALGERLRERVHPIPALRDLFVVGSDGRVIAGVAAQPADRIASLPDGAHVVEVQRDTAEPHVSGPFRRTDDNGWSVALSRAIRGPKAEFSGAVVAELDLAYFRGFFAGISLGAGRTVDVLGRDGQLLAHYPGGDNDIGRVFAALTPSGLQSSHRPTPPVLNNPLDGRTQIYASETVPGFPFIVGVGVDEALALEPWRIQAVHSAIRAGLLCLAVVLLIGLVVRQLRRRAKTEEQLRVQTAQLDELFDSAPEAIVMLDLDNRVTRVNREFTRLFGYAADEARGRALDDLIVPVDLRPESLRIDQAIGHGRHVNRETERTDKAGNRIHVSLLRAPIVTATGQIGSYAIYRDTTERALAETEREKLASRLRQAEKLEVIGTMAGGIAHDFNNILAAILGYGDMALNTAPEGGALRRHVGQVMTAAHRAKALVDQILTYSRSARGRPTAVNAAATVIEALELVRASLPSNIDLRPHISAPRATVIADSTQVHQLVMNLCKNAVDAMPGGGTLGVALEALDTSSDKRLSHGLLPAGNYVRLSVQDTGSGMVSQVAERIFEPFFTTKQPGMGTGLGLALVHAIVTDLGGAIDVSSLPGEGSAFDLYLPRSAAAAMQKEEEKAPLTRGRGECVLLVEDEEPLMLLTEEMLAALNYEPTGFTDAAEALSEFRSAPSHFDAVVLDYLMPGMTGIELAAQLRQLRGDIPIVLVSGYTGPLLSQEALIAGVDRILTKPLDLRQLAEVMTQLLARSAVVTVSLKHSF